MVVYVCVVCYFFEQEKPSHADMGYVTQSRAKREGKTYDVSANA